jgi:DNA-directed RNA polymerase specialized sigma24 family protein
MLDRNRADDLTQKTFLALIRHVKNWQPESSLRAYLFGIAFRIAAAERRKQVQNMAPPHQHAA